MSKKNILINFSSNFERVLLVDDILIILEIDFDNSLLDIGIQLFVFVFFYLKLQYFLK